MEHPDARGVNRGDRCIACNRTFECGMGKEEPCWCSTDFAATLPVPQTATGCYCPQCLAAVVAAARGEAGPG